MSAIFYKNLPYGAGGSNVEANPSGSATDDLEKIGIDGTVYDVTDADAVHSSDKGVANGVASLDATGRVPSTQLPSYVDDVLEYASQSAFPATGESGKIYIALDTNKTYRWSGSAYVEISESLALGETTGTAYEGSKGKANADNIATLQTSVGKAYLTDDSAETDLQDTDYIPFYDTSATAKKKSLWSNIKAKLKAYFDTLYDKTPTLATVATSGSYNDLSNKPTIPTVNNKTLTIQKNGTQVAQFTANSSSDVTANITVPTGDLASINKDGTSSTKYLRGDGTWQNFPSIPAAQIQSDWNQTNTSAKDYIKNKPTIPSGQIQSDWNQTTTTAVDYIKNKPTIPAAVAVKGDKESTYRTGNVNLTPANIGALASDGTATNASGVKSLGRITSANQKYTELKYFLASSSMNTGKPPEDAGIIHCGWDWDAYHAQIAIGNAGHIYYRNLVGQSGEQATNWQAWKTVAFTSDFATASVDHATTAGSATKATQDSDGNTINTTYSKTDNKVAQTADSTNSDSYELLLSGTADNTTRTEGAKKTSLIQANPNKGRLILNDIMIRAAGNNSYKAGLYWNTLASKDFLFPNDTLASGATMLTVATREWVNGRGYLTSSSLNGYKKIYVKNVDKASSTVNYVSLGIAYNSYRLLAVYERGTNANGVPCSLANNKGTYYAYFYYAGGTAYNGAVYIEAVYCDR